MGSRWLVATSSNSRCIFPDCLSVSQASLDFRAAAEKSSSGVRCSGAIGKLVDKVEVMAYTTREKRSDRSRLEQGGAHEACVDELGWRS